VELPGALKTNGHIIDFDDDPTFIIAGDKGLMALKTNGKIS